MEKLRLILCALFGHPPVVNICFGEVTCGRCKAIIGDTLMGTYNASERAILGHECETCDAVLAGMTWTERLLTRTS